VLRDDRDFRLFWAAYTSSLAGTAVSQLAFPLTALLVLDATPARVALLVAVGRIPTVLLVLVGGAVADRVRRRRLLVAEQVTGAAIMASIPLAHAFGALTLAQLFVAEVALRTVGASGGPRSTRPCPAWSGVHGSRMPSPRCGRARSVPAWSAGRPPAHSCRR
jgi:MFS family permease